MIHIGVDPGKDGGYAIIEGDKVLALGVMDEDCFVRAMLGASDADEVFAVVEKVGAMPGQGVVSMFSFGKSAGFVEGVVYALGIPYQLVTPRAWKKEFGLNSSKERSIEVCKRLFPGVDLRKSDRCRKEHDGIAEALLMAEYVKRLRGGE